MKPVRSPPVAAVAADVEDSVAEAAVAVAVADPVVAAAAVETAVLAGKSPSKSKISGAIAGLSRRWFSSVPPHQSFVEAAPGVCPRFLVRI